jgi:hypothetical protein
MNRGIRPVPLYAVLGHQMAIGYLVDGEITTSGSVVVALWLLLGLLALNYHKLYGFSVLWAVHTGPKIPSPSRARVRAARERLRAAEWAQERGL